MLRTACLYLALLAPVQAQTTWYVDASATPPGSGTQAAPYASVQYAVDRNQTQHGDTLRIAAGTYVEDLFVDKAIALVGADGPEACILEGTGSDHAVVLRVSGAFPNQVELRDLTITGGAPGKAGVNVELNSFAILDRCRIVDNAGLGILCSYDVVMTHCTVAGNGEEGLRLIPLGLNFTDNCIVWGNGAPSTVVTPVGPYNLWDAPGLGAPVVDPLFWNPGAGDYRLQPGSPAIDAGDPTFPPDPDGSAPDLGYVAYEAAYAPEPVAYCTAGTSAAGCAAMMSASGTASASASSGFVLTASGIEGDKSGLFFYAANGRQANPWGNGTSFVCVVPPRLRGALANGGGASGTCGGVIAQDLNARWCATCPKPAHNPGAGALMQAQLWYRDPASTSNQTSSMSDAIEFGVVP